MKVKYIGDYYKVYLEKGRVYDVELEEGMYRIYDVGDEDSFLYNADGFEIVEENNGSVSKSSC